MGYWSASLYGNDVAADLSDVFRDVARLPFDADRLIGIVNASFPEVIKPDDESHTDFCLALADLCHTYGIQSIPVRDEAINIIASGDDLERKRQQGMTARDLRARSAVLERLSEKLARPNPKPRSRRVLREPERWIFDEGHLVVYPTSRNEPINPYMSRRMMTGWSPDGWGGFAVLGRTRLLEYFAVYLIAILSGGPSFPSPGDLAIQESVPCTASLVRVPASHPRRMRLDAIARLNIQDETVEAEFPGHLPPFTGPPQILANALLLDVPGSRNVRHLNLRQFLGSA